MCNLGDKAQWHVDFNGGQTPILETPEGSMLKESGVISQFASDYAKGEDGIPLYPSEAHPSDLSASMASAKMRLDCQAFDKFLPKFFPLFGSRFTN